MVERRDKENAARTTKPCSPQKTCPSKSGDQTNCQDSRLLSSAKDEIAAEGSLVIYCKPVEFYNILRSRSVRNRFALNRSLRYVRLAKRSNRIQVTVSPANTLANGVQMQHLLPMQIILARLVSDASNKHTAVYHCNKIQTLNVPSTEGGNVASVNFMLPEMNKLVKIAKSRFILFVSHARSYVTGSYQSKECNNFLYFPCATNKPCFLGKISLESLVLSWEKLSDLNQRLNLLSNVDFQTCILEFGMGPGRNCLSFQMPECFGNKSTLPQVQITISAQQQGAIEKSPYAFRTYNNIPASSPYVLALRTGKVLFNYKYSHNKLQITEVSKGFGCPICLAKCGSFKGMKLHLRASHDYYFKFEFWESREQQGVNVTVKTDRMNIEISTVKDIDLKEVIFTSSYRPHKRRKIEYLLDKAKDAHPLLLTSDMADAYSSRTERARSSSANESLNGVADPECIQSSTPGSTITPQLLLPFGKTRKISERSDSRSRSLLEKRMFFHSHRAQPMQIEQVFSDHDSEGEIDDDVADFEDRRMLDEFVDVTDEEKQVMHLWNSFSRKQRVIADGHIPWACEAFSRLHGRDLCRTKLVWYWRLVMIKFWNMGLLDGKTMDNCNSILAEFQKQERDFL